MPTLTADDFADVALSAPDARAGGGVRPDPIEWIESNFYLYDTGTLIGLYDCQRRPLERALSRDDNGLFIYNTVLWSWPKKSAKSSVIAAVADYTSEHRVNASVKLVANDLRQADSRVGFYIRESIKRHPTRAQQIRITPSGYRVEYPHGSRIECVPIDPSGEAGGNDDMIVYSELWGWKSKAHQRMWSEMTLSPNKFGNSQRWVDTYAGFEGESPILEQLYDVGVKQGVRIWNDLEVYENRAAKMLAVWVTRPMFPWQSAEYYAEQASTLTPNEFQRMHRNQWVSSIDAFVPIEWWDACKGEIPLLGQYQSVVIGMDAAVSGDCFAMVLVSRNQNGVVFIRRRRVWKPPQGGTIVYRNPFDKDDPTTPEGVLRAWCREFRVAEVAYDNYQLHDLCSQLWAEGIAFFRPFPQGQDRLVADKTLYDLIRDRRIVHDGDPIHREHVQNSNQEVDKNASRLRIVKRTEKLHIDLNVATSMASDRALYLNIS
jgi:phage terminase large subunit-like protein